jgi:hypothetical protein
MPDGEKFYGVYEVYKDEQGNIQGITESPIRVVGDNKEDILQSLALMASDTKKYGEIDIISRECLSMTPEQFDDYVIEESWEDDVFNNEEEEEYLMDTVDFMKTNRYDND